MQLTIAECQNALIFLERVDLKGKESLPHAELTMKIQAIGAELSQPPAPPAAVPDKTPPAVSEVPIEQPLPQAASEAKGKK